MFGPIGVTGTTVVGSGIGIAPAKVRIKYRLKMLTTFGGIPYKNREYLYLPSVLDRRGYHEST